MKLSTAAFGQWFGAACLLTSTLTVTSVDARYQSGPHTGAVYAASMVVSSNDQTYLTGITYDPTFTTGGSSDGAHCFVASAESTNMMTLGSVQAYGADTDAVDACRSLAILSGEQLVVVGNSDNPGGIFTDTDGTSATNIPQVGFGMTVKRNDLSLVTGSNLFTDTQVPYPQAVVMHPDTPEVFFVASMTASQTTNSVDAQSTYPNWTHLFQHGSGFELTVEALMYTPDDELQAILNGGAGTTPSIKTAWSSTFPTEDSDGPKMSVYVGGMIYKANVGLIVAGSTAAQGIAYGPSAGSDEDGFVTVLSPISGELLNEANLGNGRTSQRFGTAEYDIVTSICDDPNDPDFFYIVGATRGNMGGIREGDIQPPDGSEQAFIRKIKASSLGAEWTVQHGAYINAETVTTVESLGCVVKDTFVYMTGNVNNGAGMIQGTDMHVNQGGNDVWVTQYQTSDGTLNWMQQAGSSGDEQVARNGPIQVNLNGDAIVYGDTNGSMYRQRGNMDSKITDIFTMKFARDTGLYDPIFETTEFGDATVPIILPVDPDDVFEDVEDDDDEVFGNTDAEDLSPLSATPSTAQIHQSGPNLGAMYASSVTYDPETDLAIVSGISYTASSGRVTEEPGCLVARIEVASMQTKSYTILGTDDVLEACRGIAMTNNKNLIVVGNSEPGGLYANERVTQTGFGIALSNDDLSVLEGGSLFSENIPYPEAVLVDGGYVYVASMTSNDQDQNINDQTGNEFPNWTFLNKYGKGFTMTIEKLTLSGFQSVWSKTFPVEAESDGKVFSVFVGGLVLKQEDSGPVLVAVGSTRAKGPAYGPAAGTDEDGFITLLDPDTGNLIGGSRSNIRIGSSEDDVISEICDVPDEPNSVIIVGATKGKLQGNRDTTVSIPEDSTQWFAKKIRMNDLGTDWTIQGGAVRRGSSSPTSAFAVGCHVRGNTVFLGGTVENGASIVDGSIIQDSQGGDDIFVVSLDLSSGSTNWVRQHGSVGDDQLARNGGLTTNQFGDVLIFGDSTGPLHRERTVGSNADIFLAVLNAATGDFGIKGAQTGVSESISKVVPTAAPVAPPVMESDFTTEGEVIPDDIVAIQFGPDSGPSYAGGMDYDPVSNSIYLTGATYGEFSTFSSEGRTREESQCFFSRVDLPELEVIQRDTYSVRSEMDACSAIAANPFNRQRNALILGVTEHRGLLTDLSETRARRRQNGFIMDLTLQHKFEFLGGTLISDADDERDIQSVFPVALVADEESVFTVSMVSTSGMVNSDNNKIRDRRFPNYTNGGVIKHGNHFSMMVESFKYSRAGDGNAFEQGAAQTLESEWSNAFTLGDSKSEQGMMISGMVEIRNNLIVVGTVSSDGVLSGMIAKFDKDRGDLDMSGGDNKAVEYYGAEEKSDSWIMNTCVDPTDDSSFYIVGATQGTNKKEGRNSVHAWAAKISTRNLKTIWSRQFRVSVEDRKEQVAASAYGCDVVSSENFLYVAGTVEDGAKMEFHETRSAGGDDIFVGQLSTGDGSVRWIKQVGSNGDDRVARSNGIRTDLNGNAIVYGETTGYFFRDRSEESRANHHSDVFLMIFDKHHGIHQSPLVGPDLNLNNVPSEFFNAWTKNKRMSGGAITGYVILSLVLFALLVWFVRRCINRRRQRKMPVSIYDAAAADLGYDDDVGTTTMSSGRSFGLGRFTDKPDGSKGNLNLSYRDNPEGDSAGGLTGNFHKTYSDLPQNGKEII